MSAINVPSHDREGDATEGYVYYAVTELWLAKERCIDSTGYVRGEAIR